MLLKCFENVIGQRNIYITKLLQFFENMYYKLFFFKCDIVCGLEHIFVQSVVEGDILISKGHPLGSIIYLIVFEAEYITYDKKLSCYKECRHAVNISKTNVTKCLRILYYRPHVSYY